MDSSLSPTTGLYKPNALKALYYGPSVVQNNLLSCLPSSSSKAFIITGNSLATKTPLVKQVESLLTPSHHAGTFSKIQQHAPVAQLDEATALVLKDSQIDTIISIGGGSPIDTAKAISYRTHEKTGSYLTHITIPTTLSAAECTAFAGYTREDGVKTGLGSPECSPAYIFYDPGFGAHTPTHLFLSTGFRALDHAVEMQYHPTATLVPAQSSGMAAIKMLFDLLPKYKENPKDEDIITRLFLAAFASLGFLGGNMKGGLGLSHTMGYALGSPYGIQHGITSCLTLGHVVKLKAKWSTDDAAKIAAILTVLGEKRTGDDARDAQKVGDMILDLVDRMGLKTSLTEHGVGKDQLDTICKRATGGKEPGNEQYEGIKTLTESLWYT